jgi:hypothetical protein
MPIRWQFVEGYEGNTTHWSWRTVRGDGTIESQSEQFSTYGQAVSEAIKNGFQPRQQHWVVATRHTVPHFRPGQAPMTIPVTDKDAAGADIPPRPDSSLDDSHPKPPQTRGRRETH